jgi:FKBP-type peptidyl-prolyl cis-trans isomerase
MAGLPADTSGEIGVAIVGAGCIARHFYGTKPSFRLLYPLPQPRMKSKFAITLGFLALGLAAAPGQEVKLNIPGQPAPAAAAPAKPAFSDAQLIEEFGWFVGKRVGLAELELSPEEIATFLKGLSAAASGKDSPYELEKIGPAMDEFMQKKQAAYLAKLKNKSMAENVAFFAKLKENKAVVELPSGLRYEIVAPGSGPAPKPTETVKVHYTGKLLDGSTFDSSVERKEPAEFQLDQVIPGWTEGLQKLSKGGKIKLYVPPHLAYGDDGRPGIPPGSTLVFDVELLDIKPATAAAPAAPGAK